jgi:3-methyl-2-oxobutanoate hydroxymethyltransferase
MRWTNSCGTTKFPQTFFLIPLKLHDMLGLQNGEKAPPKFVKNFLHGKGAIQAALAEYVLEVRQRKFPAPEHSYN